MNRYLVLFVVLFLSQVTWVFPQFPLNEKVADAILSPLSPISNSPTFAPFSSSSMAAFSPEIVDNMAAPGRKLGTHRIRFHALIIASASVGVLIMSLLCLWFYHKKISDKPPAKKNAKGPGSVRGIALSQIKGGILSFMKTNSRRGSVAEFDYKALETATGNFQECNVVGEGGFGCVYKARLDEDYYVAVKKVDGGSQDAEREFENELDLLSKIKHANIVSLLGYCICEETRFLVYELMKNGSLETQLHGPSHGSALTWHLRMKIALDVARGLEYLHEHCHPPVIHRDLKSSNILLDSNFNAKLSDFCFAVADGSQDKSSIKLSGTMGYVAPEYLSDGKLSDKSDVYAFGVMLLELLLGRKPVEKLSRAQCQSLVTWAMPQLTDRSKLLNIVDPAIKNSMDLKHLYQVAAVAVLCVQPEPSYRPLITDVLHSLIPLVPVELGGTLRASHRPSVSNV